MSYPLTLLISLLLVSCSIGTGNAKPKDTENKKKEQQSYKALLALEQQLVKPNLTIDNLIADSLYGQSLLFIQNFSKSKYKEQVLIMAAKSSDGLNRNKENIQIIDQLLTQFPNSENAPNFLYNKGKIYEEKLNDISTAKLIYHDLIKKYPKSELAKSMTLYIHFLNQSEEEQLDFLKQK